MAKAPQANKFIKIYVTRDEEELSLIIGLLDCREIRHLVVDLDSASNPGETREAALRKAVLVEEKDRDRARLIVEDFLGKAIPEEDEARKKASIGQRLRAALESLFIALMIPGKKADKGADE